MKNLLVVLVFMCCTYSVFAQARKPSKSHYLSSFVELSGQTGYAAPYLDFLLYYPNKRIHHALAVGCMVRSFPTAYNTVITILPFQYNMLMGKSPNYFEIGTGFTILLFPEYEVLLAPLSPYSSAFVKEHQVYAVSPRLGYRYQDINGGLFGKFSIVPTNISLGGEMFQPILPVSISLGYTF
jgi:hypothetical protein